MFQSLVELSFLVSIEIDELITKIKDQKCSSKNGFLVLLFSIFQPHLQLRKKNELRYKTRAQTPLLTWLKLEPKVTVRSIVKLPLRFPVVVPEQGANLGSCNSRADNSRANPCNHLRHFPQEKRAQNNLPILSYYTTQLTRIFYLLTGLTFFGITIIWESVSYRSAKKLSASSLSLVQLLIKF